MKSLQDYTILLLGLLISVIPIIRESFLKRNKIFILAMLFMAALFFYFSCNKISADNLNNDRSAKKIDSLLVSIKEIHNLKNKDSLLFEQFVRRLKDSFNIRRDPISNQPIQIYNTHIYKAETVKIGSN